MAWSDPGDFTSGQILTAAQMDSIREAMFFGQGTFTTETARDTAYNAAGAMSPITLQEGMRAYLTAPTSAIVTATGTTTAIPTGITTVYNGSNWVCITPVATSSVTSASTTSGSFVTTLTGDTAAQSVTLVTGTTALITLSATNNVNTTAQALTAVSVSGATTRGAVSTEGLYNGTASTNITQSRSFVLTGLNAGTNTFTLNYLTSGGTLTYVSRSLVVAGVA